MKRMTLLFSWLLVTIPVIAQQDPELDQLFTSFSSYSELPREVAYVHLNKSIYLKGEEMGFKAYVMDKEKQVLSKETRNLYCTLSDSSNQVVISEMILISDGVGFGSFKLNGELSSGKYTFRAFTNWMLNFSEPNHFEQVLEIMDPETDEFVRLKNPVGVPDIQFLPEGGRAVKGLEAVYGVIVKDPSGLGVPHLEGSIHDESGMEVTRFKVNQFGIGRVGLLLDRTTSYSARFRYQEEEFEVMLPPGNPEGIVMKLVDLKDRIGLNLERIAGPGSQWDSKYHLSIHNGEELKTFDISFEGNNSLLKIIPREDLFKGMNVITLLDSESRPLLERLFFNDVGFEFLESFPNQAVIDSGQVEVNLTLPGLEPGKFNSLSLSVLPEGTQSYLQHHSLPSYSLLQPYIRGAVEDASYYFQKIDARKRYDLDNLLITQGWSSYSWNRILNYPPQYRFDFEKGISFTVRFNMRESDEFYIHPTANNSSQILKLKEGEVDFMIEEFYPLAGEKLVISEILKNGGARPPKAAVHFKPAGLPKFNPDDPISLPGRYRQEWTELEMPGISFQNLERLQLLDEVVVSKQRNAIRIEKLRDRSRGNLDYFEEDDPRRNQFLSTYLSGRGYIVAEEMGRLSIVSRNPNSPNNPIPIVYLDGVLLTNFSLLYRFPLNAVEYIEINKSGVGSGLMGGGGVIRIVTNPALMFAPSNGIPSFNAYDIPLAYGVQKRFYAPQYPSYQSAFYKKFGTIDWFPDIRPDEKGNIQFKVKDYGLERFRVFVQGILNDKTFALGSFTVIPKGRNVKTR